MAFKLCSLAQIKGRIKGDLGTNFDSLIDDQIIPSVTLQTARPCGRPDWDKAARTEFYNPDHATQRLFIASPPIASTPAVQVWESTATPRVYGASELLVLDTDYFVYDQDGIIVKAGMSRWAQGPKTVKCGYTGGYLTANATGAPEDLVEAAIRQCVLVFARRDSGGLGGQSLEGGSFTFSSGLKIDPSVWELLRAYKVRPGPL